MTSIDRSGRSPEVERLLAQLEAEQGPDAAAPVMSADDIRAKVAAIKRAAQHARWEDAALGVAADILRRARHVAEREATAMLERARQQTGETTGRASGRRGDTPSGPANRFGTGYTNRPGSPVHASRHNADSHAPHHHIDRNLQRATAERTRILTAAVSEAEAERQRIVADVCVQAQHVADNVQREASAYVHWRWLQSLEDRMTVLVRSALATGAGEFAELASVPAVAGSAVTLTAPPFGGAVMHDDAPPPRGNDLGGPGPACPGLSRRQPSNGPSTKYWLEMVQCVVLAASRSQSAAEMTGRTFEEVLDAANGLGNFNSDLRGWLQHRWYRRPGR